ncbi:hypothetical protein ALP71_01288 [Pseudomonas coronafaciens pv. garcae]|nr:hypothetical protein ALP71_01288 [Pseudomonas coronafaciens pv. garcae]
MLFTLCQLLLSPLQLGGQLPGVAQVAVLGLMLLQALIPLLEQDLILFQVLFDALQLLTQLFDMCVIVSQQSVERRVVQLRMLSTPFTDLNVELRQFILQGLLLMHSRFEFGGQLNQLTVQILKRLGGRCFGLTCLLDAVFQGLLPLLGGGMVAQ